MAEPYESIGNRVMRHFRHVIDSTVHYWLQGNMVLEPIDLSQIAGPSTSGHPGPSTSSPSPSPGTGSKSHQFVVPDAPPRTGQKKREAPEREPPTSSKKRKTKTPKDAAD